MADCPGEWHIYIPKLRVKGNMHSVQTLALPFKYSIPKRFLFLGGKFFESFSGLLRADENCR